jgi:hypothetical protein
MTNGYSYQQDAEVAGFAAVEQLHSAEQDNISRCF